MTPTTWPPPPDLASLKELVAAADVEGFIAGGAPPDEYDTEADLLFVELENLTTADLVPGRLLPLLEDIWPKSFSLDAEQLFHRRPALHALAEQIARFFGPDAAPQTRTRSSNE